MPGLGAWFCVGVRAREEMTDYLFPATALLLNWAGLLDLSECTRLRAPRPHLLKQLGVNCWKCVSERGKRCYNSDVLSEFIVELKQISRELIKVQFSI